MKVYACNKCGAISSGQRNATEWQPEWPLCNRLTQVHLNGGETSVRYCSGVLVDGGPKPLYPPGSS